MWPIGLLLIDGNDEFFYNLQSNLFLNKIITTNWEKYISVGQSGKFNNGFFLLLFVDLTLLAITKIIFATIAN